MGNTNPDSAANDREHQSLEKDLMHQPLSSGTQRTSDREFATSSCRPNEEEMCDIGARDEHQETDGGKQSQERSPY